LTSYRGKPLFEDRCDEQRCRIIRVPVGEFPQEYNDLLSGPLGDMRVRIPELDQCAVQVVCIGPQLFIDAALKSGVTH